MPKKSIGIILGFIILVMGLEWYLFGTGQIFKVLVLALGAFLGFYASEIAKKAVKARQVSNQAWAYVVNFDVQQQLELGSEAHKPIIEEWNAEIIKADKNRNDIDKQFHEKVFALYDNNIQLAATANHFEQQKNIPGKIENNLSIIAVAQEELKNWHKYLSDEDIALLGPEILFEAISYRASQIQTLHNIQSIFFYIKHANIINPTDIKLEIQKMLFYYLRARVSLERLKTLVAASKAYGLWQHTKALYGRL